MNFWKTVQDFCATPEGDNELRAVRREGLAGRIVPFALPVLIGYAMALLPADTEALQAGSHTYLLESMLLMAIMLVTMFAVPWQKLPQSAELLFPFTSILIIVLLRKGSTELSQVYAPLILLPLFWLALYGTGLQLSVGLLFVGSVGYLAGLKMNANPTTSRFQLLGVLISSIICFATHSLVQKVRQQAAQLEALAGTDALTKLPNRRAWNEELPRALARALRGEDELCVAIFDLDFFKIYNDTHGHQAGDVFLCEVALAWKTALRTTDFVARYGGEEFAVILPKCPLSEATKVLERLRGATPRSQTCSVGVTAWNRKESTFDLLERADAALYVAKRNGRNRIESGPMPTCSSTLPSSPAPN